MKCCDIPKKCNSAIFASALLQINAELICACGPVYDCPC